MVEQVMNDRQTAILVANTMARAIAKALSYPTDFNQPVCFKILAEDSIFNGKRFYLCFLDPTIHLMNRFYVWESDMEHLVDYLKIYIPCLTDVYCYMNENLYETDTSFMNFKTKFFYKVEGVYMTENHSYRLRKNLKP